MIHFLLLLGICYFGVARCGYRSCKEDQQWKVLVRDVPLGNIAHDVDINEITSIDQSKNSPTHEPHNGTEEGRTIIDRGQPRRTGIRHWVKENLRSEANFAVDPGGTRTRRPKPGHKLWQYLKDLIKSGIVSTPEPVVSISNGPESINQSNTTQPMTDAYIVGGVHSIPRAWPWQASIQFLASDGAWHHFCGGSLIHERWIVTAAHCVTQLEHHMVRVVLGEYLLTQASHQEQVINPSRMLMHAYYDPGSLYYDIAMIKLGHSPTLNSNVNTVTMASGDNVFDSNSLCYITGWGKTNGTSNLMSDALQESLMTIVSRNECRKTYKDVVDTQICVESATASACTGDSGSPLVCVHNLSWVLAGLASWIGNQFCQPTAPNVFTRMSSYKEWVGNVTLNF